MAPVITLVVPSRLQHRARRSLSRPTAERPRKTAAPVVCILTALAGRLQHQRVREQGGGHRRQARLWENISSHLASHAQPRGRVGRTRHASCSQSLLDSQFGLRWAVPSSQEPRQSTGLRQMRPSRGCPEPRPAARRGGPTASLGRWRSLLGRAGPGRLALSPHGGAPWPRGRGRRPRAAAAPASPRGARAPSPQRPPPASRGIRACRRPDWWAQPRYHPRYQRAWSARARRPAASP